MFSASYMFGFLFIDLLLPISIMYVLSYLYLLTSWSKGEAVNAIEHEAFSAR